MATDKDLYAVLKVSKTASENDLRKAYRALARKYHPDVNPDNKAAEERFKEVAGAYAVLSDAKKRQLYDEFGTMGLRDGFDAQKARAYARWRQAPGAGMGGGAAGSSHAGPGSGAGFDFDLGDIFGDWFGGKRPGAKAGVRRGRDLSATVEIDFVQALRGCEVAFQMPARAACARCHGTGKHAGATCGACGGSGRAAGSEVLTVRIPRGADNGSKLRVGGRGEPGPGGQPGDLLIETRIRPHAYFRRDGLNLILRLPVTMAEAYSGATVSVPTATSAVNLRIPALSQAGTRLRLKGKGVQRGAQAGDMFVELDVRLPDIQDPRIAEALEQAQHAYKRPVRDAIVM